MKKRITALLLCLVMVFSLIPTTVWAAAAVGAPTRANSSVPLTLTVSSYGAPFKNGSTGEHTVSSYKASKYIKMSAVGSDNASGSATARFTGSNDTGWTLVIDVVVGNYRETWTTNAKVTNKDMSDATGSVTFGLSFNTDGGTSTYIHISGAKDLPQQKEDITLSYDANGGAGAPGPQTQNVTKGQSATFTVSSTVPTREGYTFKGWSTVKGGEVAYTGGNSITISKDTTLYAVWEEKAPVTPDDPKVGENFNFSKDIVKVICETTDTHNDSYGLKNGYYSVSDKKQLANGNWQCKITIDLDRYFALYNSEHTGHTRDMNHPKATSIMTIYPTWYASTEKWSSAESLIDAAEIYVKCEATQPEGPGENDTPNMAELLTVECVTADAKHTPKSAQYDIVDKGTLTQATDTTWTYTVTLNRTTYIDKFNGETKTAHTDKAPNDVITLTWNWKNGKWTKGFDENPVIKCECVKEIEPDEKFPVHVVIYRNGDTSKAYKDIALESQPKGHVINLNELDIADYYTANYTGKYDFYGWYDDGLMNIYNANVKAGKDAPAGLTTKTVNGWTNIKCMVYDYEKVVYFKSAEDLAAYQADHSKTDGILLTTTARKGDALPTADAPAATRTGYTFKFWSREGQNEDVTGQTVGGWTNLYANWEINTYNIAATLYMNGADSSVQETGKTYPWSHRYGGEYGKSIDYTDMFAALKAKALEVDAANEPYDAEIKLCFPKSEELFNEKILTYGQDGAFWNPGVKNTAYIWGHATTSYEVIFNTGDGSKVDTQIVKYGELATEPTTELKGYDFLGWFDADGNPFDFNNTEITHKTTLTAKWEKKTYIIASDLRINGGDANLADGKTYPWSYRYGGKFEETIDYTEMFDALKTRAMKVDEANGPVDSVVTLCFPGDYPATAKKLFNDTILTYGQDGGGWNPGNKNTAPIWGFATNVYAVTFNYKDDKTATATQNVEYGNMATEPQKVDRPGYRFLGWFTEDGKAFDFSTPITKSMTLTAKWEIVNINAYIIPITSDGTQLVGAGFDMALNTTTLGRVGLPGYEDEDAVRIHFATFASSAGLADADDYFPGTDPLVVKAVADLKNGLERRFAAGVNEAKADGIMSKTDWTYLHVGELDDEEDTNFLSGNLVFYSARFVTEDSEHVTGMPNAEYTHNAVAVYDYYLDGETITIPDAVPERYGYDFLGWSVKAVPAENDKLLKAGDTVTVDGDVVFTAQWKLKEYTVSFDSKGGTKVDSQIVEHGSTATKPGNPHRNDYTFKGWYLDGKKFDFSTPITGDITLVARWATKTSGGSNGSSDTTTKDNGKTVQSGKTFDGGIALYVGLSVLSATGSALVITKKKRG